MLIDIAKQLLKKGIALEDDELIEIANNILDSVATPPSRAADQQEASATHTPSAGSTVGAEASDFLVNVKKEGNKMIKGVPVNEVDGRTNTFVDDQTEHTDIETPRFKPTQRREPATMHTQTCQECTLEYGVLDAHKRDYFVCDKCLGNKRRSS